MLPVAAVDKTQAIIEAQEDLLVLEAMADLQQEIQQTQTQILDLEEAEVLTPTSQMEFVKEQMEPMVLSSSHTKARREGLVVQ